MPAVRGGVEVEIDLAIAECVHRKEFSFVVGRWFFRTLHSQAVSLENLRELSYD